MDITVSSPGSPGTSFTGNVKNQILIIFDVLNKNEDFASVHDLGTGLGKYGINRNCARNIFPFLQNCGIVNYQDAADKKNKRFFTNIGNAYVDILRAIKTVNMDSLEQVIRTFVYSSGRDRFKIFKSTVYKTFYPDTQA